MDGAKLQQPRALPRAPLVAFSGDKLGAHAPAQPPESHWRKASVACKRHPLSRRHGSQSSLRRSGQLL
eukprot:5221711-Pyramimonas_sp.AAC.1